MKEEIKILRDSLESIAKKLDRYFFLQIVFTLFGLTILLQQQEVMEIPILGIKINDPAVFHALLAASITAIFGIIGSGLLDYFSKRRLYDDLLTNEFEVDKSTWISLITRSQYENVYKSKDAPEVSRLVIVVVMSVFLFFSNFISLWHAYEVLSFNRTLGVITLGVDGLILILLYISFVRTIITRILKRNNSKKQKPPQRKTKVKKLAETTLEKVDVEDLLNSKSKESIKRTNDESNGDSRKL